MALCQVPDKAQEADISRLMEQHGDGLLRFCYLNLGDFHLAQDAVQETFVKAYRKFDAFRGDCSEMSWLCAIAINCCCDIRRSRWFRHESGRSLEELPETSEEFKTNDDTLIHEVMSLPRKYREVILLHYYQGISLREIAQTQSINESTLSTRLKRARNKLRSKLEGWYFDEE
ncbi:MAG: sigma-70 family RNA polymerase sigma factor [Christensenellales bacterium]